MGVKIEFTEAEHPFMWRATQCANGTLTLSVGDDYRPTTPNAVSENEDYTSDIAIHMLITACKVMGMTKDEALLVLSLALKTLED